MGERASNDLDAEFQMMVAASGGPDGFIRSGRRELRAELDRRRRLPRRCRNEWDGNLASGLWLDLPD
ncbi:hypothetical protein [Kitasatospora sp. NPDC094011]|uniref:hypothetical protein n=1 Tax=Kitasatospora sp. NPDC094011 TaxID=3364090 RepID=UPI0038275CA1